MNVGEIEYAVNVETQKSINAAQQFDKQMNQVQSSARKTDKELSNLGGGFNKLAAAIKGVIAVSALKSMAGMVQQYQAMSERVRMATSSTEEFELVQRRLQATADGTYRNLAEAQEVYINTSAGLKDMGYNAEQTLDIVDSLSYAFVRNATSSDAANAALNALTRAVNRGTVQSERWATIYNAVPTILDDIAAATGRPREELSRLGYEGKLSTDLLTEALLKARDANKAAADSMSTDLIDAAVRSRNALTTFLVNIENQTGVIQAVTDGIIAASEALLEFGQDAEKMETFLNLAKVAGASLAAVMAGRVIMTLWASSKAFYANVAAARAMAGSMSVATVAANGLRTAMAFLGGPAGVVMLAAVAIYSFTSASRKAAQPTDDLTKSVKELSAAQRELAALEATRRLEELGEKARVLADNLKYAEARMGSGSRRSQRYTEDVLKMRVEQEKLNEEISVYRKRLEDLQNYKAPDAPASESTGRPAEPTTTPEGQKRLQAMRDEIELAKKVGAARARLAAVQRMGADATAEEREEAERLATELYNLEKAQEAAKKATEEARNAAKSDKEVLAELTEQLYQTTLEADALRDRQAELQLSKYATPEQVAEAQRLARAIAEAEQKAADLERRRSAFGADVAGAITGSVSPLSGGMFDDQTARYEAEAQAEQQRYADAMERLREAKELELEVKGGYMALEEQMAREHAARMAQIEKAKNEMMMTQAANAFGSMVSNLQDYITTFDSENKELMAMMKASAIAQTIIQTYQGAQQAYTSLSSIPYVGPALGAAAAAAAVAGGMARVASIRAQGTRRHGGPVSAGSMYRVNEGGAPEIFQNNLGQQYMIPNSRGEVISNKDAQGGGGGVIVNIHNAPQGTNAKSSEGPNGEQMIDIWIADFTSDGRTASVVQNKFGLSAQGR